MERNRRSLLHCSYLYNSKDANFSPTHNPLTTLFLKVGYGDYTPKTTLGKIVAIPFIIIGTFVIASALGELSLLLCFLLDAISSRISKPLDSPFFCHCNNHKLWLTLLRQLCWLFHSKKTEGNSRAHSFSKAHGNDWRYLCWFLLRSAVSIFCWSDCYELILCTCMVCVCVWVWMCLASLHSVVLLLIIGHKYCHHGCRRWWKSFSSRICWVRPFLKITCPFLKIISPAFGFLSV